MENKPLKICKNCTTEFKGKYCPSCSQKASVGRITTRDLFQDVLKKYLPFDKGFLFTARQLLIRPGLMVRDYLDGKRVNYTKPLSFLILLTAASLIFFPQAQFEEGMKESMAVGNPNMDTGVMQEISQWIYSHMAIIIAGMIPFIALSSKWFHRKSGINYAEQLVLNVYLVAGCTLVSLPFSAVTYALGTNLMQYGPYLYAYFLFYLSYFAWGYIQFFKPRNKIWEAVKAFLSFLVGYFLYILVVGLIGTIAIIFYKLVLGR